MIHQPEPAAPSRHDLRPPGHFQRWFAMARRLLWLELIGAYAAISAYMFFQRLDGGNAGADFIIYYAASLLTMAGETAALFDWPSFRAAQATVIQGPIKYLPWLYPPPILLLAAPLASLPYLPAFAVWVLAQLGLLAAALRGAGKSGTAYLGTIFAAIVFPATINNMLAGQNGALSAALLGGGLVLLKKHPGLAGLLLGCLIYKPHLALMLPVALLAAGAWRTIATGLASAMALSLLSLVAFGAAPWAAFWANTATGMWALEYGSDHWAKMATVFSTLRLLGVEIALAYGIQIAAAAFAAAAVIMVWRRGTASLPLRGSALLLATFLATPYAFFYDLVVLIFVIVWLGQGRVGRYGRSIVGFMWLAPVALWVLARYSHLSLWPVLFGGCLVWVCWLARRERT
ncbi:MAG: DUF2029 domain-containing protein [Rhodospirillaceae bacterium]|nr:DUF2029 domain-containing protein [Rhodospirillaceae bacterium]MBT6427302.1 DUF2029 domain-containing protein [Rhodospirillaceae bacterium]MBT7759770.1 DUF2029 domain-containing protein [Rhodospirillaceae bacterium]